MLLLGWWWFLDGKLYLILYFFFFFSIPVNKGSGAEFGPWSSAWLMYLWKLSSF